MTNIILTGFMGTGKTTAGRLVAERLGRKFIDTDSEIARGAGMSIPEIFDRYGEGHFRSLEELWCRDLGSMDNVVIATGGGMPVSPGNRRMLMSAGIPICLRCSPAEIRGRVRRARDRPMLDGNDLSGSIEALLSARSPAYSSFPFQVDTTGLSSVETADRILHLAQESNGRLRYLAVNGPDQGGYAIVLGAGALDLVGDVLRDRGITSRVAVVTDTNAGPLYLERVAASLEAAGLRPFECVVPAGEQSKSLSQLDLVYGCLVKGRLDRRGAVLALGGGVIGDLAGFAAATYMRGVALTQCPTTLLAMVDSSVGGKTGIDLEHGKNLVGAFKQPLAVVADTDTLKSLPSSQVRMGMAELIKHAVIDDPGLFQALEKERHREQLTPDLIQQSVEVKIRVVESDPFESGRREVLNLGHTVGHALEKCSHYAAAHGDAVSVGMVAAALISHRMGMCSRDVVTRIERVLRAVELPVRHTMAPSRLIEAMAADKKAVEGRVRFTLIRDLGVVEHGFTVESALVREVLESIRE